MTPTKFLFCQIAVVFAIVTAGIWFATQLAAHDLGYQGRLGSPWFVWLTIPIYTPFSLFRWWYWYDAYAPHFFDRAGIVAGCSGFMEHPATIPARSKTWGGNRRRMFRFHGVRGSHRRVALACASKSPCHHLRIIALGD